MVRRLFASDDSTATPNWNGTQRGEGFEFHLLVLAMTAFLVIRGAGAFSVDRVLCHITHRERPQNLSSRREPPPEERANAVFGGGGRPSFGR
jgi:hypothetical protein